MMMMMMITLLDLQSILSSVRHPLFCCSLTLLTKLMASHRHADADAEAEDDGDDEEDVDVGVDDDDDEGDDIHDINNSV